MSEGLRLLAGALLASLGALTLVPAPASALWPASVIATEFGYCLVAATILVLWPGWRRSVAGRLGALLSLVATVLLVLPVVRAVETGRVLPDLFAASFGTAQRQRGQFANDPRPAPFVLTELLRPVQSTPVRYERRVVRGRDREPLVIHVYRPAYLHGPIPGVIVLHGESWQGGDGMEFVALNGYLAARDFLVVSISDRLDPRRPFPGARDDVISAIAYVKGHASEFGLDPTRLALLGRSVAGHLALLVAYTVHDPAIRGAISLYAPSDMQRWYESAPDRGVIDTRDILRDYFGGPPGHSREGYDRASPITFVGRESPATLLVHGMHDEVVSPEQSERLAARLQQEGVQHLFVRLPWATHACDKNLAGPCGQITTYAIERFLNTVMQEPAPPAKRGRFAGFHESLKQAGLTATSPSFLW